MKRNGSILLLVIIILTPLLLMSACLWRSIAYSVDLAHLSHTAHQRHALTQAGLVLVGKRLNAQQQIDTMFLQHWPDTSSPYDLSITLETNQDYKQAIASLIYNKSVVYTLRAHYMLDASNTYRMYYAPSV